MSSRLALLDAQIILRKQMFDAALNYFSRRDRSGRLLLWCDFLADIAPLVAEREALLKPTYVAPRWRRRQIRAAQIDSTERRQERAHRDVQP
jgi:hypothetical protein